MRFPRVFQFIGYETRDVKEFLTKKYIEVHLTRETEEVATCSRCSCELSGLSKAYKLKVEHMPVMGNRCYLIFVRRKGYCKACKKQRSEAVEFISEHTPHKSKDFAWWLGRMCEIAPVTRVAELMDQGALTTWRMDLKRMKKMFQFYKLETAERLSVDEVYVRKKKKEGETRSDLFFTVISDLKTRRVIWVSEGRSKEALDQFFILLGESRCKKIRAVAMDQFVGYRASVKEYCPAAKIVWDRFHIMQNFEKAMDSDRRTLHLEQPKGSYAKRMSAGRNRFIFLTKASRRTKSDQENMKELMKINEDFFKLELIKEKALDMYNMKNEHQAKEVFEELGRLIFICGFKSLLTWYNEIEKNWEHIENYFKFRISTGLSEGDK